MAGKHSKTFLETVKDNCSVQVLSKNYSKTEVSLPFKIVATALVLSLVLSAVLVGRFFVAGNTQKNILTKAKECFEAVGGNEAIQVLSKNNSDIKGWLNISGTDISYAVCHGKDNQHYTSYNQNGQKSRYGAIVLSATDSFERNDNDRNIVLFGNNMKDGTMFGSLKKYRNLNFYKQNPEIELYYGDQQEKYIVFAIMLVSSYEDDAGSIYNPSKSHFADEEEFNDWYSESCARSLINTTVTVEYGNDILTLVTSADDFEGARLVVLAKKTTDFNTSYADVSGAVVNAKIKYPKIWYIKRGLEYPY